MSLQVTGKANEWVVVINNGVMKQAGIGLSVMRGPNDQVAIFPSKVNKVVLTAEQITEEMQGLKVSAMIVWTINRDGDGPMKAYKNLGEDLMLGNPATANALISSMASAIIRNCIANSTINQIIKNRDELKAKIISSLKIVTLGWGVWLETVEITDVKISSGTLFKNLQCQFRKDEEKKAQIQSRNANHEIKHEKEKHGLETSKRNKDTKKTKDVQNSLKSIVTAQQKLVTYKNSNVIAMKKY
jgi:uncharacterized membrane protein YqiK